jgi:hypothetical protein
MKFILRYSISAPLLCKRQRDNRIRPVYAATVTRRRRLWPMKLALESTVTTEVGIPGLSHISIGRNGME